VVEPHVESLTYTLAAGVDTSYAETAPAIEIDHDAFSARLDTEVLTVTPKEHFTSEAEARAVVDPFLRAWEVRAALESGRPEFRFSFSGSVTMNRAPPAGTRALAVSDTASVSDSMHAHVTRSTYPAPPKAPFEVSPEVAMLHARWEQYTLRGDTLLAMSYFCLTLIEEAFGGDRSGSAKREYAANALGIDNKVLDKLGELTAKGDPTMARKFSLKYEPLRAEETAWVEPTIRKLILRVGVVAALGCAPGLPDIGFADLPPLA
jgi:hypothetical protein